MLKKLLVSLCLLAPLSALASDMITYEVTTDNKTVVGKGSINEPLPMTIEQLNSDDSFYSKCTFQKNMYDQKTTNHFEIDMKSFFNITVIPVEQKNNKVKTILYISTTESVDGSAPQLVKINEDCTVPVANYIRSDLTKIENLTLGEAVEIKLADGRKVKIKASITPIEK